MDLVGFAVDFDGNVAAFSGFGGEDDALGGFETPEGGDLWFGGSFGSFGDFDHLCVFLWLNLLLLSHFYSFTMKPKARGPGCEAISETAAPLLMWYP